MDPVAYNAFALFFVGLFVGLLFCMPAILEELMRDVRDWFCWTFAVVWVASGIAAYLLVRNM